MTTRRISIALWLSLALLAASLTAEAQPAGRLGYTEGKSITIEYRFAEGRTERLSPMSPIFLRELVISMKAARALGLTIPQSLLLRADHIVE